MSFKALATLALATGFAIAKPISQVESLPAFSKRQSSPFQNGAFGGDGFNFIDGFNNFNDQQQVVQIKQNNLQIIDNGRQQVVVQQAQEVLIVDQQRNGFNNDLNNLFRKSNFARSNRDVTTVMLVVQEIQIAVDDGRGNVFQQNVFAQQAVVAGRGRDRTETVMLYDQRTLNAADILGRGGIAGIGGGIAAPTLDGVQLPTKTNGIQLLGAKPTWTSVAEDPAAELGGVWQAEIEDAQAIDNNQADADINDLAAQQEKAALEQALAEQQAQQQGQDQQAAEEQKAAEEAQKQADEQKAAEEAQQAADQAKADQEAQQAAEQAKADEAQKAADAQKVADAQKAADEQAAADAAKAAGEQKQ